MPHGMNLPLHSAGNHSLCSHAQTFYSWRLSAILSRSEIRIGTRLKLQQLSRAAKYSCIVLLRGFPFTFLFSYKVEIHESVRCTPCVPCYSRFQMSTPHLLGWDMVIWNGVALQYHAVNSAHVHTGQLPHGERVI